MSLASVRPEVVGEVRSLLAQSQAYRELPEAQRAQILTDMTKVSEFLAGSGVAGGLALDGALPATARGLEDKQPSPEDVLKMNAAKDPGLVQQQFRASAVREGTEAFRDMVQAVDFPKFVASLVQGVFRAIVEASIQQMQAFSELLAATSKSVDQFAGENITDGQARDFLANRHPESVRIDTSGQRSRLRAAGDDAAGLGKDYGLDDVDLEDDEGEQQLVTAAKMQMARSRQQSLATMVL